MHSVVVKFVGADFDFGSSSANPTRFETGAKFDKSNQVRESESSVPNTRESVFSHGILLLLSLILRNIDPDDGYF